MTQASGQFALSPTLSPEHERLSDAIDNLVRIGGEIGRVMVERRGADHVEMRELLMACSALHEARLALEKSP